MQNAISNIGHIIDLLADYPKTPADEMSVAGMRELAREARVALQVILPPSEEELRAEFETHNASGRLDRMYMGGPYRSLRMETLWNQHKHTAAWIAGRTSAAGSAGDIDALIVKAVDNANIRCNQYTALDIGRAVLAAIGYSAAK